MIYNGTGAGVSTQPNPWVARVLLARRRGWVLLWSRQ